MQDCSFCLRKGGPGASRPSDLGRNWTKTKTGSKYFARLRRPWLGFGRSFRLTGPRVGKVSVWERPLHYSPPPPSHKYYSIRQSWFNSVGMIPQHFPRFALSRWNSLLLLEETFKLQVSQFLFGYFRFLHTLHGL